MGRCEHPRNSPGVPGGGQKGWLGPSPWLPKPPSVMHFPARERLVGSLFGQVPGPQGPPPTPLSALRKRPFWAPGLRHSPRPPCPRTAALLLLPTDQGPVPAASSWGSTSTWGHWNHQRTSTLASKHPRSLWGQSPGGGGVRTGPQKRGTILARGGEARTGVYGEQEAPNRASQEAGLSAQGLHWQTWSC